MTGREVLARIFAGERPSRPVTPDLSVELRNPD